MASHFTISKGQGQVLLAFLKDSIGEDMSKALPKLVNAYEADGALKLVKLKERLEASFEEEE